MLKWVLVLAVGIAVLGFASPWLARHGLGRLPGDITVNWRGRRIYIPFTTTIVLSLALTLLGRLI